MSTPDAPIVFRELRPEDRPAVSALAASLRRWFSPHDLDQIDALLRECPSGWIAATAAGDMIGFALDAPTADPGVRELAWMGVAGERQGRGIGTRLLEQIFSSLRGRGYATIEVSTVARSAGYAPYEATRAFYYARGFKDVRIDPDYYWPGGDRLVLQRSL